MLANIVIDKIANDHPNPDTQSTTSPPCLSANWPPII